MSEKKAYPVAAGFLRVVGMLLVIFGALFSIPSLLLHHNPVEMISGMLWLLGLILGVVLVILAGVIQKRRFIGEG